MVLSNDGSYLLLDGGQYLAKINSANGNLILNKVSNWTGGVHWYIIMNDTRALLFKQTAFMLIAPDTVTHLFSGEISGM